MPTYTYRCANCGQVEAWRPIKEGPGQFCPDCGMPANVVLHPFATKSRVTRLTDRGDRTLTRDREAYHRLRMEGLQPKSVNGSADLEKRADTKFEVESGRLYPGEAKKIEEGEARVVEIRHEMERRGLNMRPGGAA